MTEGIIGKKLGMTQVFGEGGKVEAITAIEAGPCTVTQVKTTDNDGYSAVQLGFGEAKKDRKTGSKESAKEKGPVKFKYVREFKFEDTKALSRRAENRCQPVQSRRQSGYHRHFQRQRVCRRRKTLSFPGRPQDARPVRPLARSGLRRPEHQPRACV